MNRKIGYIVSILVAFLLCFGLVNHVSKHKISLPLFVSEVVLWFESLFDESVKTVTPPLIDSELKPNVQQKQQYLHIEAGKAPVCRDVSLGKVGYKKVGGIYTWTDTKGIQHFSDRAPEKGDYKLLNYAGEKVLDYFSLTLNTESLPYDFHQSLSLKLSKLFVLYGKLLDTSSLKKVDIDLQIVTDELVFRRIQKEHNMAVANQSDGFYSHRSNKAYLLYKSDHRAMQTAIHEATHAINRAVIGYSAKWVNEGLAEYSETISVMGQIAQVSPSENWTQGNSINVTLLPLSVLFSAKNEMWSGKLRQRLYATSWAFIYYMMENKHRRNMLARLINTEQKNVCNVVTNDKVAELLGAPIKQLQKDFVNWSKTKLRSQQI